jgi:hypothetical protein
VARRSIFSRFANARRSSRRRSRQQPNRHLAIESIEGRLLLSVAPVSNPVLNSGQIFTTPRDSTPSASDGGYITTGPITYSSETQAVANGIGPRISPSTVTSSGLTQHFDIGTATGAVTNDINPRVVGIEFLSSGEGGPIGLSSSGMRSGGTSDGARPLNSIVDRGANNLPRELLLASLASPSTLASEWARPTISEVAGDEPSSTSPTDQMDEGKEISPLHSLPKLNTDPSVKASAAKKEIDPALQDSAQSSDHTNVPQRTADSNRILQPGQHDNSHWIDGVLEHDQDWTSTMRAPNSAASGIAFPASYLRSDLLDRKLIDRQEPASSSPSGPRVLKSAARSNASITGIIKSATNLEPLLIALLFDYVASRNFQQVTKKQSPEADLAPKISS